MSRCKINIILIFGFVLIVNLLFFPCNRIEYSIHYGVLIVEEGIEYSYPEGYWEQKKKEKLKEERTPTGGRIFTIDELMLPAGTRRVSSEYVKVFFPLVISRANKYKAYVKWESSALLLILEKKNEGRTVKEISEIYQKKIKEFHDKFGYQTYYYQFSIEFFFIELALLILIGSLSYIFFCVVLWKIREAGVDRIKRRKIGIILCLIGIGIPLVFSHFQEYFDKATFNSIGIILFLIGTGVVIFSFLPSSDS